jgi:anti-sigma-K factor RskA
MGCALFAEVTTELALGVLTGRERAKALAHLDHCRACGEDVRRLMATAEELLRLLPASAPPAGFETRVLDRLGLAGPDAGKWTGWRALRRSWPFFHCPLIGG